MTSYSVPLVPNNLARPPVFWTSAEVKAWVEFCVQEFSLSPIAYDRFFMNGKALLLLTRADFMERAPQAGDVLYNAFRHLSLASLSRPSYALTVNKKNPVYSPPRKDSPTKHDFQSPPCSSSSFVPILPHPAITATSGDGGSAHKPLDAVINGGVPAYILSPAETDKSLSDTESCHNYCEGSPKSMDVSADKPSPGALAHNLETEELDEHVTKEGDAKGDSRLLWEFIFQLLNTEQKQELVSWESVHTLEFRINDPTGLATQWGLQKNRNNMTYEKLSRALRYYYKMNIIRKVPGKKLTYQFMQPPNKICKGQRGARPHSMRVSCSASGVKHNLPASDLDAKSQLIMGDNSDSHLPLPSTFTSPVFHGTQSPGTKHNFSLNSCDLTSGSPEIPNDDPNKTLSSHLQDRPSPKLKDGGVNGDCEDVQIKPKSLEDVDPDTKADLVKIRFDNQTTHSTKPKHKDTINNYIKEGSAVNDIRHKEDQRQEHVAKLYASPITSGNTPNRNHFELINSFSPINEPVSSLDNIGDNWTPYTEASMFGDPNDEPSSIFRYAEALSLCDPVPFMYPASVTKPLQHHHNPHDPLHSSSSSSSSSFGQVIHRKRMSIGSPGPSSFKRHSTPSPCHPIKCEPTLVHISESNKSTGKRIHSHVYAPYPSSSSTFPNPNSHNAQFRSRLTSHEFDDWGKERSFATELPSSPRNSNCSAPLAHSHHVSVTAAMHNNYNDSTNVVKDSTYHRNNSIFGFQVPVSNFDRHTDSLSDSDKPEDLSVKRDSFLGSKDF